MKSLKEVYSELSVEQLTEIVESRAYLKSDRHYTILKFSTHYKGMYGTPINDDYTDLRPFNTLKEVLIHLAMMDDVYEKYLECLQIYLKNVNHPIFLERVKKNLPNYHSPFLPKEEHLIEKLFGSREQFIRTVNNAFHLCLEKK